MNALARLVEQNNSSKSVVEHKVAGRSSTRSNYHHSHDVSASLDDLDDLQSAIDYFFGQLVRYRKFD